MPLSTIREGIWPPGRSGSCRLRTFLGAPAYLAVISWAGRSEIEMTRRAGPNLRSQGLRLERIRSSAQFSGDTFRNTALVSSGLKKGTVAPTVGEFLWGGQRRVPPGPLPARNPLPIWTQTPETGLRATWL